MDAWVEIAVGVIMMLVLGPAVGNYATSIVYRLPKGQTPFEKNPYCDDCGAMLQPKDLFPILSYMLTRGQCRYCHTHIPMSYTVIEMLCGLLFIVNYLILGISESFVLITAIGVFLITLSALEYHQGKLYTLILTYILGLGMVLRVLQDGTIYDFFFSGFAMLFVGAIVWRIQVARGKADTKIWPDFLKLMIVAGVLLPTSSLPLFAAIALAFYGLQRVLGGGQIQSPAMGVAVYAVMLHTQLFSVVAPL